MEIYKTNSLLEFEEFAKNISKTFKNGDIILLNGNLGAGKTTFVKMVAKELGITKNITSPTFTLMKKYEENGIKIYHFDLYRIDNEEEVFELGLSEFLYEDAICFIEWNKFTHIYKKVININIKLTKDIEKRIIEVIR